MCFGIKLFSLLTDLCAGGIVTGYEIVDPQGRMVIRDDGSMVQLLESPWRGQIFVPLACSTALADGTCEGTATFIESVARVSSTCAEDGAGDCLCDVGGSGAGSPTASSRRMERAR